MHSLNQIRSFFLDYFKKNNHNIVNSYPLVPHNDPTLMFTTAGMVQFKNVFTGDESRSYKRAASSQKCVRAGGKHNDLDNVGYTARHHTFFEMLGNFSFGDYFKEEAIFYAWEFLTKDLSVPKDKLYITVYHTDDEAIKFWKKITSFNDNKILKIDTNDNFWSMGDTGPCGPCTEIFYDHGDKIFGGLPGTKDQDGDRYIEIWNLVFMQYQQMENGKRIDLPKPSIDTGMGLERISALLQGTHNNYETDLFKNIINYTENIVKIAAKNDSLISYRVIADHIRSCSFLIADGVMPSNEGRGYVLRRIMRRAMRHVHQLGYNDILMHQLVPALILEMGDTYPELVRGQKFIEDVFIQEEKRFKKTLGNGMKLLNEELHNVKQGQMLDGDVAFKLYDTYGFPLDLTIDILKAKDLTLDEDKFKKLMEEQKIKARNSWSGSGEAAIDDLWFQILEKHGSTEFLGYNIEESEAIILEIVDYKDNLKLVITNQTPFYGESGGQMGDIGTIKDQDGLITEVTGTIKFLGKIHAHICKNSNLKIGMAINLIIDSKNRDFIRSNHSATHLLHHILRKTLGEHVVQKGSLVSANRLRFDFSHPKSLSFEEIIQIEKDVNRLIRKNSESKTSLMDLDEAMKTGAMSLFGEKYEEEVRVVNLGVSTELCGGTHVHATGDIGLFKITSESAISSGVRRIEAVTSEIAIESMQSKDNILNKITETLKTNIDEVETKINNIINDKKKLEKELSDLKTKLLSGSTSDNQEKIGEYNFIFKILKDVSQLDSRNLVDSLRFKAENNIVVAASLFEGKTSLIIGANPKTSENIDSSMLVKLVMEYIGAKAGGGRKDIAQAGGFDFALSDKIVKKVKELVHEL